MDRIGYFPSFQTLKTDAHFASILGPFSWSFSLIFQAVTPCSITVRKFYCQNHKKNPEAPEKIFRCSSKNFSGFHEKFWPVSRDHFACHFKVIWPVPRFAFVPKWTKLQAGKKSQKEKGVDGANEATGTSGYPGKWDWPRRLSWSIGLI